MGGGDEAENKRENMNMDESVLGEKKKTERKNVVMAVMGVKKKTHIDYH